MGQAVIHDTLSLGILVEVPPTAESAPLLKDILFTAHKLAVNVQFEPIDVDRYEDWVENQGKDRYIITMLSRKITSQRSEEHTSELQSHFDLVWRLLLEKQID